MGMAISNGLIALAGGDFVQTQGGADISIGVGTIVIGLAAVIIGETIIPSKKMFWITLSAIVGLPINLYPMALSNESLKAIGFGPKDVNLVTALLVVFALILPKIKSKILSRVISSRLIDDFLLILAPNIFMHKQG